MSAWIVTPYHIDILITWAAANAVTYTFGGVTHVIMGDEPRVAKVLMKENVRSVNARYGEKYKTRYKFIERPEALAMLPGGILKATGCLDYQSCETDDYESTEAKAINKAIERAALCQAMSVPEQVAVRLMGEDIDCDNLPGYKDTKWGLEEGCLTEASPNA